MHRPGSELRASVRDATIAALLVLAAVLTQTTRLDVRYARTELARPGAVEASYVPPPAILRVLSLGHEQLVADMLFIRTFSYFIDHLFGDRTYDWLRTYIDTLIALDPYNPAVYRWASQVVKYGQTITQEDIELSIHYSEMGAERFPNDWRFWLDIGFNYMVEWRKGGAAERERMRDKALDYFAVASALPGSRLDASYLTALFAQRDDRKMALFHAYQRYYDASDREREELLGWIQRLEADESFEDLSRQERLWKEQLPFVELSFFAFIGPMVDQRLPASWDELDEALSAARKTAPDDGGSGGADGAGSPDGAGDSNGAGDDADDADDGTGGADTQDGAPEPAPEEAAP